jgi:hypothetical protein
MSFSEQDMEDAVANDPGRYLGEKGLKLTHRQYSIGNYRFDLLFEDRHGAKLIVELQKGTLDRNHFYKILDYYEEYKSQHPDEFVELMVVANRIKRERRNRLADHGIEFKEIPESDFTPASDSEAGEVSGSAQGLRSIPAADAIAASDRVPEGTNTVGEPSNLALSVQERFFRGLLVLSNTKLSIFRHKAPESITPKTNFLGKAAGLGPTKMDWVYDGRKKTELNVGINFFHDSEEINDQRLEKLREDRAAIEAAFGEEFDWGTKEHKTRYLCSKCPVGLVANESLHEDIQNDLVERMARLVGALTPYLERLR